MEGLISGDTSLIADTLFLSKQQVHDVLSGKRVKRQTLAQVKVQQAAEICKLKNAEKVDFIEKLAKSDTLSIEA